MNNNNNNKICSVFIDEINTNIKIITHIQRKEKEKTKKRKKEQTTVPPTTSNRVVLLYITRGRIGNDGPVSSIIKSFGAKMFGILNCE